MLNYTCKNWKGNSVIKNVKTNIQEDHTNFKKSTSEKVLMGMTQWHNDRHDSQKDSRKVSMLIIQHSLHAAHHFRHQLQGNLDNTDQDTIYSSTKGYYCSCTLLAERHVLAGLNCKGNILAQRHIKNHINCSKGATTLFCHPIYETTCQDILKLFLYSKAHISALPLYYHKA